MLYKFKGENMNARIRTKEANRIRKKLAKEKEGYRPSLSGLVLLGEGVLIGYTIGRLH